MIPVTTITITATTAPRPSRVRRGSSEYTLINDTKLLSQQHCSEPTLKEQRVARAQFLALCWALFIAGWTDGSTGPLLPRIQIFYDVS